MSNHIWSQAYFRLAVKSSLHVHCTGCILWRCQAASVQVFPIHILKSSWFSTVSWHWSWRSVVWWRSLISTTPSELAKVTSEMFECYLQGHKWADRFKSFIALGWAITSSEPAQVAWQDCWLSCTRKVQRLVYKILFFFQISRKKKLSLEIGYKGPKQTRPAHVLIVYTFIIIN